MSAERRDGSHARAWAPWIAVGLPVLYLLSVPPCGLIDVNQRVVVSPPGREPYVEMTWLDCYRQPYAWLSEKTPAGPALRAYERWFWSLMGL